MIYDCIVIHYAEIGTKGKNRPFFERTLMSNIKHALRNQTYDHLKRYYGRFVLYLKKESDLEAITTKLKRVFGISSFSPSLATSNISIDDIKQTAELLVPEGKTVQIHCKRPFKAIPLKSPEVCQEVAKYLQSKNITLDCIDPEVHIMIEITESKSFIHTIKEPGQGGLPVGVSGKVLIMLSGGIDSPVAAHQVMKRGCTPVYVHFHSHPHTSKESINKAKELANILSEYTPRYKLYLVKFTDIQKKIMMGIEKSYRIILYRRYMLRIAERIAFREKAQAIITGDNLGQVASQTLSNLRTIQEVTPLPILRPVLTWEKQEIINKAKDIETYETSIQPHDDCCSLFVPKHPATSSNIKAAEGYEERIGDVQELINEAIKTAEKVTSQQ